MKKAIYLKINQSTHFALNCFYHWIEIVEAMDVDYFIVVDRDEIKTTIKNMLMSYGIKIPQFIPSYRNELMPLMKSLGFAGRWPVIGCALLTPFLHAKENGYDYFWNIDADDTIFYCEAETIIPVLHEAEQYAIQNSIDVFSLDMYYSSWRMGYWTFGVAFVDLTRTDYIECIKRAKDLPKNNEALKYYFNHNIDQFFEYMSYQNLISTKAFSCDDLWFQHEKQAINTWKNGKIVYHYKTKFIEKRMESNKDRPLNPENLVQLSTKIYEKDSSLELKNKFVDRILKYNTFYVTSVPGNAKELSDCFDFEAYLHSLFSLAENLIIIISTCDNHTPHSRINRQLQLLYSFGIKTDLQSTFGYSFIAVIDEGKCATELLSENTKLSTSYKISENDDILFEITSQGFNTEKRNDRPIRIALNGIDFATNRRGLNFVVYDKRERRIIDSVAFDTFDNNVAYRNTNLLPPRNLEGIKECTGFIAYILGLYQFREFIDVFIVSRDAHTNPSKSNAELLRTLSMLGLKSDFESTYRYSYIGVIDGGNVTAELLSANTSLEYKYEADGNEVIMESSGFNATHTNTTSIKIEIKGINEAVDSRGLNFVVWDKLANKLLDSICFDTFADGKAIRKN